MLTIYSPDQSSAVPLSIPDDKWFVVHKYNGKDTLSFDISPEHECYPLIGEEIRIGTAENRYIIKDIDEHGGVAQIDCEIDIDDWRKRVWKEYRAENLLPSELLTQICPEGWKISGAGVSNKRMTLEASDGKPLEAVTAEAILYKAAELYDITVNFHAKSRTLFVIDPASYTPSGEFLLSDLNLRSVGFNGSSKGFATRLYAWGKDDITFAPVNGGKEYVEDNSYSDRVISIGWKDTKCTTPTELLAAARKKLKELAFPSRSYECDAANLHGDIWLYKAVTLLDGRRQTRVDHRVVEYKEYPARRDKDVVTLSASSPRLESSIQKVYDDLKSTSAQTKSELQTEIDRATGLMTGAAGGHVVIRTINGVPEEILIMNTADMNTAQRVWRWNVNGFAFSRNGVNGPYTTAITMDGKIVADFILAGTLSATLVRGGVLQSQNGMLRFDLNGSSLYMYNSDGTASMRFDNTGQHFYEKGDYLGKAGTNQLKDYPAMKGIEFDLDTRGNYMCWACKKDPGDDVYTIMLSYARPGTSGLDSNLSVGCDLNMRGHSINSVRNLVYCSSPGSPHALEYISDKQYVQLLVNYGTGSQFAKGITTWNSDGRLKQNIAPSALCALDELMKWKHRTFEWKNSGETEACGYIAQEMKEVNPAYVLKVGEEGNEVYQMDERRLIPVMSKAIQELKAEVDVLKSRLDALAPELLGNPAPLSEPEAEEQIRQYEETLITECIDPIPPKSPIQIKQKKENDENA